MPNVIYIFGEAGSVAVVPRCFAPMGPGSIPSPDAVCAFDFQSMLQQVSPDPSIFPPASKTGLLR